MPRAPKITAGEFGQRNPQAKGVFRTSKKGQKFFIAFEKKHRFPQGNGVRVTFGRGSNRGNLSSELQQIKRNQERAERQAKIKKGIGLFDNPLSQTPKVVGVKRIVRKQQLAAQIKRVQQGKSKKISKRALAKLQRRKGGQGSIKGVVQQGKNPRDVVLLALTSRK